MQWLETAEQYIRDIPTYADTIDISDVFEIFIIAFMVYYILAWMKTTRSWKMVRGLLFIFLFLLILDLMDMTTIVWIFQNVLGFIVTALIVVMQPELRHALEELGQKSFLPSFVFSSDSSRRMQNFFSEKTINEITKACVEMGKARTGALIVIEKKESLKDYERTGIEVDAVVTSQLLVNIFEHNTPLHDGAVIVRGNRITYATCYLPLSDNLDLSKELGTRHRAGVGISEATDSMTVIVSEETGKISIAYEGELERNLNADEVKEKMRQLLNLNEEDNSKARRKKKVRKQGKEQTRK